MFAQQQQVVHTWLSLHKIQMVQRRSDESSGMGVKPVVSFARSDPPGGRNLQIYPPRLCMDVGMFAGDCCSGLRRIGEMRGVGPFCFFGVPWCATGRWLLCLEGFDALPRIQYNTIQPVSTPCQLRRNASSRRIKLVEPLVVFCRQAIMVWIP